MKKNRRVSEVVVSSHQINGETESAGDAGVPAVLVRDATKCYGVRKNRCAVLQSLDMSVQKGIM